MPLEQKWYNIYVLSETCSSRIDAPTRVKCERKSASREPNSAKSLSGAKRAVPIERMTLRLPTWSVP